MTGRPSRWGTRVLIAAVLLVAACGSGGTAGGKTSLRFVWWGNDDRAKATKSAVEEFMRRNPDITVSTEFSAYDAYFQKLSTEVAGGAGPDLLQLDRATLGEYQHRNVLAELDSYAGNA
jgi:multiple sugar transport system substrate-binding protein